MDSLRSKSDRVKIEIGQHLIDWKGCSLIKEIIKISNNRVRSTVLTDEDCNDIVCGILNRISNVKIGTTIKMYRSNNLTRVNDVKSV